MNERYNKLNEYLKQKYGEKVLKICVDGGFTCPNRTGEKGTKGCLFCSARGSGDHLTRTLSISEQVQASLDYKSSRANKFIVYFQAYSNTYQPVYMLREKYNEALSVSSNVVGLQIATRPDCINKEICECLSEFNKKNSVVVELGLQTASDRIGEIINRQYSTEDFVRAVKLLNLYNMEVVVHIMVGLPTDTEENLIRTIDLINSLPIKGVKIHSTYVVRGTGLEKMYLTGEYTPITKEFYLHSLEKVITRLRPDIVIHRLSGDPPKSEFVAPLWMLNKKTILNGIDKILKEKNLYQGIYYKK